MTSEGFRFFGTYTASRLEVDEILAMPRSPGSMSGSLITGLSGPGFTGAGCRSEALELLRNSRSLSAATGVALTFGRGAWILL